MSLTSMLQIATSGLRTAQTGIRTVSDNVANVNTAGYVRKVVDQQAVVISGAGFGVEASGIRRVADLYLQKATLNAAGEVGRAGTVTEFMDRAQSLFGDPSSPTSFFARLNPIADAFSIAGKSATSDLYRSSALIEVTRLFDDARAISAQLRDLTSQTKTRIDSTVTRVNSLLDDINALNVEISRANITGRDATGAENVQSQLIDELSTLIDLRVQPGKLGGVALAATDGTPLSGVNRAKFLYGDDSPDSGTLRLRYEDGQPVSLSEGLVGGELKALFELKDLILPALSDQLGEFTSQAADALNRAHNAAATAPAPPELTGRRVSSALPDALDGFKGQTTIALTTRDGVNDGRLERRVDINFDPDSNPATKTGTMTVGATVLTFDPSSPTSDFLTVLNQALLTNPAAPAGAGNPALGQASFTGGVLKITAVGPRGVTVADPPDTALKSDRAGRGFSHYFGLNDLVRANGPTIYDAGLRADQPHGFAVGGELTLRLNDGAGARFRDVTLTIAAGDVTLGQLRDKLNLTTGVNGAFSIDPTYGGLRFTSAAQPQVAVEVLRDTTVHTVSSEPLSRVHGVGASRGSRADQFQVRADITAVSANLSLAQFEYGAAVGDRALSRGDGRGAFNVARANEVDIRFERAGEISDTRMTLSNYAAQLGGVIGRRSQQAQERLQGAETIANEAISRRSSVEGVNIDEELVQLTVYQQSYNASARLIAAAKEMFDVLANLI